LITLRRDGRIKMIPGRGEKYEVEIETIAKPKDDYLTEEYFELDLPLAAALMVGNEIVVEGADVAEVDLEKVICRHLGLPEPDPQEKGFFLMFQPLLFRVLQDP